MTAAAASFGCGSASLSTSSAAIPSLGTASMDHHFVDYSSAYANPLQHYQQQQQQPPQPHHSAVVQSKPSPTTAATFHSYYGYEFYPYQDFGIPPPPPPHSMPNSGASCCNRFYFDDYPTTSKAYQTVPEKDYQQSIQEHPPVPNPKMSPEPGKITSWLKCCDSKLFP